MEPTHPHTKPPHVDEVSDRAEVWERLSVSPETPLPAPCAARYLDVSVNHLYRLVARREVAYYKPAGKRIYLLKRDLDQYCLRHRVASDEEVERRAATYVTAR